jgi:CBS domain-containing protein
MAEETAMRIRDVMTSKVETITPEAKLQEAARQMADKGLGFLPVGDGERLVGMITDRDIAVRSVAEGKSALQTKVRDVMTKDVLYCFDDEDTDHIADNMANLQIRRLPVVNRDKRLVGVVSLADIALKHDAHLAGEALEGVCLPTERD